MRCVVLPDTAIVFTKRDIEHPMQTVLDAPVTARCFGEGFGGGYSLAADVEGALVMR